MTDPVEIAREMDARVTRLSNFELEVSVDVTDRPWRRACGVFRRRRDAEKHATAMTRPTAAGAPAWRQDGDGN